MIDFKSFLILKSRLCIPDFFVGVVFMFTFAGEYS